MNRLVILIISVLLIPNMGFGKEPAKPLSVDTIQVLKIAPQDERAVIRTPDGEMRILKVGDQVGARGRVTEISKDRVVVQERIDKNSEFETVIIRLLDGKQSVERIQKVADKQRAKLVSLPGTTESKR